MLGFRTQNDRCFAMIGDSQGAVFGDLTNLNQTSAARIASRKKYGAFFNGCVSGETTADMLARFSQTILVHRPSGIGILGGTNDIATNMTGSYPTNLTWVGGGVTPTTTKANLKAMVQMGQSARARVTLCSWYPTRYEPYLTHAPSYLAVLSQVVSETGCEFVDIYTPLIAMTVGALNDLYQSSDLVHPNAAGHEYLASQALADQFGSL